MSLLTSPSPTEDFALLLLRAHRQGVLQTGFPDSTMKQRARQRRLGHWRSLAAPLAGRVKRRRITWEKIGETPDPVLLEVHGRSGWVLLRGMNRDGSYRVQFADEREAWISPDRLRDAMTGWTIAVEV